MSSASMFLLPQCYVPLQVDALLPNIRPKDSRRPPLNKFLFSLHAFLSSLSSVEPQHPLTAARALSDSSLPLFSSGREKRSRRDGTATSLKTIAVPYPQPAPTEDANWKVAFDKPVNISIVGAWINNVAVKRTDEEPWVIDVAVEMSSARLSLEWPLYVADHPCHRACSKRKIT